VIVPTEVQQWYSEARPRLVFIEDRVKATLDNYAGKEGFLFSGRIKSAESLSEKIDTGRVAGFDEIDDAYAATIVVPTYSYERQVRSFLTQVFHEQYVAVRGSVSKPPEAFRFDSTRVYCRLSAHPAATPPEQMLFEVQILSAMDYAWQTVTHDLVYKHSVVDWRRVRAASEMKAMVEQLDQIGEGFDTFVDLVRPGTWPEIDAKNEVTTRLDALFSAGALPLELQPEAMSRVADAVVATLRSDRRRYDELRALASTAMDRLTEYIQSKAAAGVPKSLTLAQLVFGVMYRCAVVSPSVKQVVLINEALLTEFPELRAYAYAFGPG
jgi:ppGpp synthetase/RelA/SpoT-type nucleotidyltranferase